MWSPPGVDPGTAARAVAVLLVASLAGRAFQRVRLPRISGYLLTGAALGPRALAVLGETHAARLAATDAMCLAVIGIAAGAELQLADLRRHPRPTLVMTACVSVFSFGFVFLAFLVVGPRVLNGAVEALDSIWAVAVDQVLVEILWDVHLSQAGPAMDERSRGALGSPVEQRCGCCAS